jgi:hypothetical protein
MNHRCINVLLVGESAKGSSFLSRQLERHGCCCWFASSMQEALSLVDRHAFHLVLGTSPMQQANPLLSLLGDSDCNVFYSLPVEDGCWWLPLVRNGRKCLGTPALRPSEFVGLLDEIVKQAEAKTLPMEKELQEV